MGVDWFQLGWVNASHLMYSRAGIDTPMWLTGFENLEAFIVATLRKSRRQS
jgi:hypothetical protein